MRKSDLSLNKYWVTQSGYFRLSTTVTLGMIITDEKLLFCHVISEGSVDKKISTIEYNTRTFYYCSNNLIQDYHGSPALNLPPITIDDRPRLHLKSQYTPDMLPYSISVSSEKSVSGFTTSSGSPQLLLLPSYDNNYCRTMKKYQSYRGRVKRGY